MLSDFRRDEWWEGWVVGGMSGGRDEWWNKSVRSNESRFQKPHSSCIRYSNIQIVLSIRISSYQHCVLFLHWKCSSTINECHVFQKDFKSSSLLNGCVNWCLEKRMFVCVFRWKMEADYFVNDWCGWSSWNQSSSRSSSFDGGQQGEGGSDTFLDWNVNKRSMSCCRMHDVSCRVGHKIGLRRVNIPPSECSTM